MLMAFPGINNANVRFVLDHFTSMQDLVKASKGIGLEESHKPLTFMDACKFWFDHIVHSKTETLGNVLKSKTDGQLVWNFLHQKTQRPAIEIITKKSKTSYQKWKDNKK